MRELCLLGHEVAHGQGHVDLAAPAILSAIQGGLLLSQPERDPWPLRAALDQALHTLDSRATSDP